MFEHNRKLNDFLTSIDERIERATDPSQLITLIDEAQQFEGGLEYNNNGLLALMAIALITAIVSFYISRKVDSGFPLFLIALSIFTLIIMGSRLSNRNSAVDALSEKLFKRDLLFDNQLQPMLSIGPHSYEALIKRFSEFNRGNHTRTIKETIAGRYEGEYFSFNYHYFHFHYVNRHEEETTDSEGRRQTKVYYDPYDRYGLYIDTVEPKNLIISYAPKLVGQNRGIYRPSSNLFNRTFLVQGESEFVAAKFLTPSVVTAIEASVKQFSDPRLEFNAEGALCFAYDDDDTFYAPRQYSLAEPEAFREEISEVLTPEKLKITLQYIDFLLQQTDNHFTHEQEK